MDLLFKRYADPIPFVDGMIRTGRFHEFVISFMKTVNREKEDQLDWEFFLHKVWEGSFRDFKEDIETNKQNQAMSDQAMETTIKESMKILKNFNPNEGGES
jgi:hypothetical protein